MPSSGWDKLVVSLVSAETGRITGKTSRGHVRNGTCQWPDPVIESTRLMQDPSTGEYDEKLYKLLVQMGSLRVGILGEATMNLSEYVTTEVPDTISLPLRNCNAGTVLHVKIQCLTSKAGSREFEGQRSGSLDQEYLGSVSEDNSSNSDVSENLTTGSVGSSASQNLTARSSLPNSQGQYRTKRGVSPSTLQRDGPPSIAASHHSSDSFDSFPYGNNASNGVVKDFPNADVSSFGWGNHLPHRPNSAVRQDSSNSQESSRSSYAKHQTGMANPSNAYSWQTEHRNPNPGPSAMENGARIPTNLPQKLEAAEATIQEMREETLMWERQARKLSVDVETLKQQLAFELKNGAELKVEMSAVESERDSLRLEVEQQKALKVSPKKRGSGDNHSRWEMEDSKWLIKALQEEVNYGKEVNADLHLQLRKTQDLNAELVSVVQELEETLDVRSNEVDRLAKVNKKLEEELSKMQDTGNTQRAFAPADDSHFKHDGEVKWRQEVESQQRLMIAEAVLAEKKEEIKLLKSEVGFEPEKEREFATNHAQWSKNLSAVEMESVQKLMEKDDQIKELLSKLKDLEHGANSQPVILDSDDLLKTIEMLKRKIEEQEIHYKELTDENIELHYKLNKANKDLELKIELIAELEANPKRFPVTETEALLEQPSGHQLAETQALIAELELQVEELERKTETLEGMVCALQKEKEELEVRLQTFLQETAKKDELLKKSDGEVSKLREDLKTLLDTERQLEVEIMERCAEVDKLIQELADREASEKKLEVLLFEANNEKVLLDSKLRDLMEEMGLKISLIEMEKADMQEKLDDAQRERTTALERLEELVEQMEVLRTTLDSHSIAKRTLESRASELLGDKQNLEAQILDLEELNVGLSERVSSLEVQLRNVCKDKESYRQEIETAHAESLDHQAESRRLESHQSLLEQQLQEAASVCTAMQTKCAALEAEIMQRQGEGDHREETLRAEIESLLSQKEGIVLRANRMEEALIALQKEKAATVDLLQSELEQLSLTMNEKEKLASQAMVEAAKLRAEKMELEHSLKHMQEKMKELEEELSSLQKALKIKIEDTTRELNASRISFNDLTQKLQETECVLQQQLMDQEEENKEFKRRVELLEEELLHKADAVSRMEQQLMLFEAIGGDDSRPIDNGNSKVGLLQPADSKEVLELRERLHCLEDEAKASKEQLIICRREFTQRETALCCKIEHLEVSNEQLAAGLIDSGADQLKNELIRLQNQNSFLSRREQELLSTMHMQEVLQEEVKRLQESNDLLEARLSKFVETAKDPFILVKIVNLETELAEAVEANNMYKLQLKSFFDKQHNVSMAALQEIGDVDQVINDLFQYKKKATQLEGELHSMHERYSLISLQLAEAESERGELMITVKNLRGMKKM